MNNKTPVRFTNKTLLVDSAAVDRMISDGRLSVLKLDGVPQVASIAFIHSHIDSQACKKGWIGMKGRCRRKSKRQGTTNITVNVGAAGALPTVASLVKPVAATAGGVAATAGLVYAGNRFRKRRAPRSNNALKGLQRGTTGGRLSFTSRRVKAKGKASRAARGVANQATYFSAKSQSGKGRLSDTIAGIPKGMSVREARRLKNRNAWIK